MSLLGETVAFGAGVVMMIGLLAALYGILDLWYMIGRAWPRVLRGIVVRSAVIVAVAWLLPPPYLRAFVSGLVAYLAFYLSLLPLSRIVLRVMRRKSPPPVERR